MDELKIEQEVFVRGKATQVNEAFVHVLLANGQERTFCKADVLASPQASTTEGVTEQQVQELRDIGAALQGNAEYYLEQLGNKADLEHGTWLVSIAQRLFGIAHLQRESQPPNAKKITNEIVALLARNHHLVGAFWQQIHDTIAQELLTPAQAEAGRPTAPLAVDLAQPGRRRHSHDLSEASAGVL